MRSTWAWESGRRSDVGAAGASGVRVLGASGMGAVGALSVGALGVGAVGASGMGVMGPAVWELWWTVLSPCRAVSRLGFLVTCGTHMIRGGPGRHVLPHTQLFVLRQLSHFLWASVPHPLHGNSSIHPEHRCEVQCYSLSGPPE